MNPNQSLLRRSQRTPWTWWLVLTLTVVACSAGTQKPALETAMQNDQMRAETFEATLQTLDEHPEYVDQFFAQALKHPRTLDRLLQNTAKGLEQDGLARMTAQRLAEQPKGLQQTMIAALDAISDKPQALQAVAVAMRERSQVAALVLVQREDAMRATMKALIQEVSKNAEGRRAFLISVQENSFQMASLIAQDPKVTSSMFAAFGKAGLKRGEKELKSLVSALDDEPGG